MQAFPSLCIICWHQVRIFLLHGSANFKESDHDLAFSSMRETCLRFKFFFCLIRHVDSAEAFPYVISTRGVRSGLIKPFSFFTQPILSWTGTQKNAKKSYPLLLDPFLYFVFFQIIIIIMLQRINHKNMLAVSTSLQKIKNIFHFCQFSSKPLDFANRVLNLLTFCQINLSG